MTKAALGYPAAVSCRAFTAATISDTAHTSKGPGLAGIRNQVGGSHGLGTGPGGAGADRR